MIKYRPHRGSLADAMLEYKEFDDIADMLKHIEQEFPYTATSRISITEDVGADTRINWNTTRYVKANEFVIGMCDLGEND